jgi:Sulfatase
VSDSPTWWRPLLTVAVFSALPFAVFLEQNRTEAQLDPTLALYALFVFAIGVASVLAADRLGGPEARERAAVVFGVAAYVFFHFQLTRDVADWIGLSRDSGAATLLVWVVLFALGVALAVRLSRHTAAWNYLAVVGVLLFAFPAFEYGEFKLSASGAAASAGEGPAPEPEGGSGVSPQTERRPDVWYFVLDGYARADVLESVVGHDNSGFLGALERRGFQVHDEAAPAYPETFLSIASTLDMRLPLTEGELGDHTPYYEAIEGDNETVRALGELGYEHAFGSDYSSFDCGGDVDLCVLPQADTIDVLIGERERALLTATPLIEVLPSLGIHPTTLRGYLSPREWVGDVESRRSGGPLFAFAHVLAPHPPYRYLEGCELKTDLRNPSLIQWGDSGGEGGEEYARAVECVNGELLDAVDAILAEDPRAIIVIQGDHGPKFDGMNFHRPLSEWTPRELRQRYPILNAHRLPTGCRPDDPTAGFAPNTFRYVLACVTGEPAEPLAERYFMTDLESNRVEEVDEELLAP